MAFEGTELFFTVALNGNSSWLTFCSHGLLGNQLYSLQGNQFIVSPSPLLHVSALYVQNTVLGTDKSTGIQGGLTFYKTLSAL